MAKLTHFRLCPHSRSIRIALAEAGTNVELVEERPWEWRTSFLDKNPAGELPVLEIEGGATICGAYAISEYLAEEEPAADKERRGPPLFPGTREERAEIRRLVDWFHGKLNREVTRELLLERVYGGMTEGGGHTPDADILRAIRTNLRYHLSYLDHLALRRGWLAGDDMSFADIAAAAHLSSIDYLGEVPWDAYPTAKSWYVRLKSRPAFRSILADRVPGAPPAVSYADLDF
jgi:glutathione S-transferase